MDDQFEDGPVCDFCEIAVDKDETLQPIYVGELPQPKPHRLSEVASRDGQGINQVGRREFQLLGKPIGIYSALYQAIRNCDDIDINESMHVEEVRSVGGEVQWADMEHGERPGLKQGVRGDVSFDTQTREDKVGVSLRIRPKDVTYEPDAEVCDTCAEMFESLAD